MLKGMNEITVEINRRTGRYEGRGAVAFKNQPAVQTRELSDPIRPDSQTLLQEPFRRFTVTFVSGHRYVADLGHSYFERLGVCFADPVATSALLEQRLSNAEVFRRAIRDFSKQLPLVYERGCATPQGELVIAGHVARPRAESAVDTRILPKDLFTPTVV